jgi:hypothetical protein
MLFCFRLSHKNTDRETERSWFGGSVSKIGAKAPPRRVEHGPRRVGLGVEAGGRTGPRTRQEEVAR